MSRLMVVVVGLLAGCSNGSGAPTNTWTATVILADGSQLDFSGIASVAQTIVAGDSDYDLGAANHVGPYSLGLLWDPQYTRVPGSVRADSLLFSLSDGLRSWSATGGIITFTQLTNISGSVAAGSIDQVTLSDAASPPSTVTVPSGAFNATLP